MKYSNEFMNNQLIKLVQVCCGMIRPDVIFISLVPKTENLILRFVFNKDSENDSIWDDYLEDVVTDFMALQENPLEAINLIVEYAVDVDEVKSSHFERPFYARWKDYS